MRKVSPIIFIKLFALLFGLTSHETAPNMGYMAHFVCQNPDFIGTSDSPIPLYAVRTHSEIKGMVR